MERNGGEQVQGKERAGCLADPALTASLPLCVHKESA